MALLRRLALNREMAGSLQAQIFGQLKSLIQTGELTPGERMPSTRELAASLQVSRNTVVAAFDMLVGQGYVEARLRSGFQVCNAAHAFRSLPVATEFSEEPDVNLFSLQIWNRHRTRALKRGSCLLHYQSRFPVGIDELRQNVASYLRDSRGVRCEWYQVAITNGSQQALFLLANLLLQRRQRVYMEDPGYPGARNAWRQAGATVIPMPVDDEGICLPQQDAQHASLIYVTPSHQFPLGVCMSLARRLTLLRAARDANSWIVEDDYDAEFRYTSVPQPSLQSLDENRRVIYIGSFSKTLFPALRLGYVVLPPSLVERFAALKSTVDDFSPLIDQATLASFLESGAFYSHLRRCRKHYAERQSYFLDLITRLGLPIRFPITGRGMNLAGMLSADVNDRVCSDRLRSAGLDVPPLSRYAVEATPPGLLFGLAAFDKQAIHRGVQKMAAALDGMRSSLDGKRSPG